MKKLIISSITCLLLANLQAKDPIHNSIYNTPSSSNAIYNGYNLFTENEEFPEKLNGHEDDLNVEEDYDNQNSDSDNDDTPEEQANFRHNSILEQSIINRDFAAVQNILNAGQVNVNYQNKDGRSALHFAAAQDNNRIVLLLLQHGADINCTDFQGWTPLHAAVDTNAFDVVTTLLEHKADSSIENTENKKAQDYAKNDIMKEVLQGKAV
jgi:ankyrin repeat protein